MINVYRVLRALSALMFALLPCWAVAELAQANPFDWVKNYSDYENNQFALELPLTQENFAALKEHLRRYQYLLLYLPANELGFSDKPNLRIGFFPRYTLARDFQLATDYLYRGQHIVKISADEHQRVIAELSTSGQSGADNERLLVFPVASGDSGTLQQSQQKILNRAKSLYLNKNHGAALQHYLFLAALGDDATAAWAGELAGLCYEKLGRRNEAVTQYQSLLKRFPESSGAPRISQRLRGLQTAAADDPAALQAGSQRGRYDIFTRGVFGQYYRSVDRSVNGGSDEEVLSLLTTDWDVRSSLRWNDHDINARINGYWLEDELDSDNSEIVLKRLLVDYRHQGTGVGAVLGRQKDSDTGVFTSFDGLTVSYPLRKDLRVAVSTGAPVYTSDVYDALDYSFYSLHSRWDISDHWLLGGYFVSQTVNGVTDREAIGLRGRYSDDRFTGSVNIDYDTAFSELNNLLLNLHYRFSDRTDITALYGSQRSPFLTATNILIGQADLDLDSYLRNKENKDSLLDDAFARTALNDYYSVSFNTRLEEDVRWLVDFYDSTLSDVPSSEFLLGLPETGTEPDSFHYQSIGTQLIFQNFFWHNDSATIGLRRANGDTSDSNQIYFYERLRLGNAWTVMPRILYSKIQFSTNNDTQQQVRYSLSLTYRPWRNIEFNLEAGNEAISSDQTDIEFESRYVFVGYRLNF